MNNITNFIQLLTIKDWAIISLVAVVCVCVYVIFKLTRSLALEIRRHRIPELMPEIDQYDLRPRIKNVGAITARGIAIQDLTITLKDFGYETDFIFTFNPIPEIKPKEVKPLEARVFKDGEECRAEFAGKITGHLVFAAFTLFVTYWNLEGIQFKTSFTKAKREFRSTKIEPLSQKSRR
ncbi:hypothetical protein ACFL1E_02010 [Candidatus Omnitrophota bacterium]